jgi:hypothetical protein
MRKLHPTGSTQVSIQNLPGDGKNILPTRLAARTIVISLTAELIVFRATTAWSPQIKNIAGLKLT